jgi:tRNA 2-selenouridine synthase
VYLTLEKQAENMTEIEIREALSRSDLKFIDVRSPGEHAKASIPGSVNVPLFSDREHRQLGIIYHQLGETEARRAALEMVAPKLPALVDLVVEASGGKKPVLYCRRGGLRSYSLCQILHLAGISALRLKKGYKAYRRHINELLAGYRMKSRLIVLHGLTGVGKTAILLKLNKLGIPIIDLEGLAGHKGSVFGAVGITEPRSQKDFDALLFQQLEKLCAEPYLVIEGEGQRIGNVYLPPFLAKAMGEGYQVLLKASLQTRAEHIVRTYIPALMNNKLLDELKSALSSLEKRLGRQKTAYLIEKLDQKEYYLVAETMCKDYYDLYYSDSRPECAPFDSVVDAEDLDKAALEIIAIIESLKPAPAETAPPL